MEKKCDYNLHLNQQKKPNQVPYILKTSITKNSFHFTVLTIFPIFHVGWKFRKPNIYLRKMKYLYYLCCGDQWVRVQERLDNVSKVLSYWTSCGVKGCWGGGREEQEYLKDVISTQIKVFPWKKRSKLARFWRNFFFQITKFIW